MELRGEMKIAILAAANSIHTCRWVNALTARGHEVHLLSMQKAGELLSDVVKTHYFPITHFIGYFFNALYVRKILSVIQPDLLHAHYASGYGTLGRLACFHPYILSVWGADVYDFPCKSYIHLKHVVKNLKAADLVCSTSNAMAIQTQKLYSSLEIAVTPFGIDTEIFTPNPDIHSKNVITIGTVKTLSPKYGIDILIVAFAKLVQKIKKLGSCNYPELRLLIVGGGTQYLELTCLAASLNIAHLTKFIGPVLHSDVPRYLNKLDIYVAASRLDSESFGVAVLEASACGLPVIVSDVGGLPEVVKSNVTGIVVPREDTESLVNAMFSLILSSQLRIEMGESGRTHVQTYYEWNRSVDIMEQIYLRSLDSNLP